MAYGDVKYEVECLVCGRQFRVSTLQSKVPKHPPKGEARVPFTPYVPCVGSGQLGVPIKPVIEGLD